jgi:LPLT family lysophospholipid transporter-like MFS transporter
LIDTGIDTPTEAALCGGGRRLHAGRAVQPPHPRHRRVYGHQERNPDQADRRLRQLLRLLWKDKLGQISLGVTTLVLGRCANLAIHRAQVGQPHRCT